MRGHLRVIAYDVVIVGAGPAGIFAALELVKSGVEQHPHRREGPRHLEAALPRAADGLRRLQDVRHHDRMGRRGRLLGRQAHAHHRGGRLAARLRRARRRSRSSSTTATSIWLEFGATTEIHGPDAETADALESRGDAGRDEARPDAHPPPGHRSLAAGARRDARRTRGSAASRSAPRLAAVRIRRRGRPRHRRRAVRRRACVERRRVVAAPGREGADWLAEQATALGITLTNNAVDIGVRVECPAAVMERLTDAALRGEARLPHADVRRHACARSA